MPKKIYSISLDESVYNKAKQEADKLHLSVSSYLTLLIDGTLCTGTSTKQQI